jgi:hypothetical protein
MTPIIYGRDESGLAPADSYRFGLLGEVEYLTIHHSAGPRARTKADAQALHRSYQRDHVSKGWGDIGYHWSMDDLGRFYELRPQEAKGTHVGSWNSNNVGLMLHGNYEVHKLTASQRESLLWLFRGGFAKLIGETEAGLENVYGHRDWRGHESNACPGTNLYRHLRWLKATETY